MAEKVKDFGSAYLRRYRGGSWLSTDDGSKASQGVYNNGDPYIGLIRFGSLTNQIDPTKYKATKVELNITRDVTVGKWGDTVQLRMYAGYISPSNLINNYSGYSNCAFKDYTLKKKSDGSITTIVLDESDLQKFNDYCLNGTQNNNSYCLMLCSRETGNSSGLSYSRNYTTITKVTVKVTYIEKAAGISAEDVILGTKNSVKILNPLGAGYRYKIKWSLGNNSYTTDYVGENVTEETTIESEKDIPSDWGSEFKTSSSKEGTIQIFTYPSDSSVAIGNTSVEISYVVPSSYSISIQGAVSDVESATYIDNSGNIVNLQNLSKKNISFSVGNLYGADIINAKIEFLKGESVYQTFNNLSKDDAGKYFLNEKTFSKPGGESSGLISIKATVTDSRNKTTSEILGEYTVHSLTSDSFLVSRVNDSGAEDFYGEKLKITVKKLSASADGIIVHWTPSISGNEKKTIKDRDTSLSSPYVLSDYSFSNIVEYKITFEILSSRFKKKSTNTYISYYAPSTLYLKSSNFLLHFLDKNSIGIGSAAENSGSITMGLPVVFKGGLSLSTPLPITSGGTEASSRNGAWENIVAPGGTMTGNLIIGDSSNELKALSVHGNLSVYLNPTTNSTAGRLRFYDNDSTNSYKDADGNLTPAIVFGASLMSSDKSVRYNRFFFSQSSPSSENMNTPSTKDGNNIYEWYYFPDVTPGLTATKTYRILTTKTVIYWDGTGTEPDVINGGIMLKKI